LKTFFVPEGVKVEIVVQSEPEASSSKDKITSKPKNSNSKAMTNSDSKTSKIKILKRSEHVPQSLLKPESGILKSKSQKNKIVMASGESELKGIKHKVPINQKLSKPHLKVQEVKSKTSNINLKGPIKQWVPKSEIVNTAEMSKSKGKAKIMVSRQCNALVAIYLFLVDFSMFYVFYMIYVIYVNNLMCCYLSYSYLCYLII